MKHLTNLEIAELFKRIAAAYQILNENRFKIIAYERAADSIEHLTSEVKDLWDDKKLNEIPGIGSTIIGHLDELMRTGKNKHFTSVMSRVPQAVFPLLLIPGLGPKKAYKLVKELKLSSEKTVIDDVEKAAKKNRIAPMEGFGEKSQSDILVNIESYRKGSIKQNRIVLAEADSIAQKLVEFLKKQSYIEQVDILGSLRRMVATIGDIDISILTKKPKEAIAYFCTYPHQKIIEQGPTGASILLHNGRQVDLRVQDKKSYGAMLQYFTGSKNHNIAIRTYALTKGMSLSEYGIKKTSADGRGQKAEKIVQFADEKKFYEYIGMEWIPPELREDRGEVVAALRSFQKKPNGLPVLVKEQDIRGDLHIHTSFNLEPSHDLGVNTIEEVLDRASELGYEYIGISDHNPSVGNHTDTQIVEIMKKRQAFYEEHVERWNTKKRKNISVFIMLEVDIQPEGDLALPEKGFAYVDAVIASIHSSFAQDRAAMTERLKKALTYHPKIKILGHPTGRLLTRREGYEVNWSEIFGLCAERHIALEINASPYRLDLTDALVFDAKQKGATFVINTDSHSTPELYAMKYGVSVARRGWAEKRDILNSLPYNEMKHWLTK